MPLEIYLFSPDVPGIHAVDAASEYAAKPEKMIRLEAFQHSLSLPVADVRPSVLGGLPRLGHAEHNLMSIQRKLDPSTIELMKAHTAGTLLTVVHIFGCRLIETSDTRVPCPILQILMSNVLITDYQYELSGETATETLALRYSSIGWRIRPIKRGTDTPGTWAECWWDGTKNTTTQATALGNPGAPGDASNPKKIFEEAGFE